jgi:hypothetical protein
MVFASLYGVALEAYLKNAGQERVPRGHSPDFPRVLTKRNALAAPLAPRLASRRAKSVGALRPRRRRRCEFALARQARLR